MSQISGLISRCVTQRSRNVMFAPIFIIPQGAAEWRCYYPACKPLMGGRTCSVNCSVNYYRFSFGFSFRMHYRTVYRTWLHLATITQHNIHSFWKCSAVRKVCVTTSRSTCGSVFFFQSSVAPCWINRLITFCKGKKNFG